jgi:plastocyanin
MRVPLLAGVITLCAWSAGAQAATARQAFDTTITVKASSSTLEFDPPVIAARHGTRVRIRFVNTGTLPHNFVIVRNEDDIDDLAAVAAKTGGDFVPVAQKAKLIAYSTLASPGQTVDITFVMPPAGDYTYVCMMTGHSNTMLGKLRSLR